MIHDEDISRVPYRVFAGADRRPGSLQDAAAALRTGALVVFPTETVYGLGAATTAPSAVRRIYEVKGRPQRNPLIVHVADISAAREVAAVWSDLADDLARHFWPGPLTLVVARGPNVPDIVTAGGPTVALRCPSHPAAVALLRQAGVPVAAPSANPSGYVSPTSVEHLAPTVIAAAAWIIDAGPCPGGIESTVLDVTRVPPRILRPGLITAEQIEAIAGPLAETRDMHDRHVKSPGLLGRHYAPHARVVVVRSEEEALGTFATSGEPPGMVAWLRLREPASAPAGCRVVCMPEDPRAYARALYDTLIRLDREGVRLIMVDEPPDSGVWRAIRDRLLRASLR